MGTTKGRDPAAVAEQRTEKIARFVAKTLADAPPLSPAQVARLRALFGSDQAEAGHDPNVTGVAS